MFLKRAFKHIWPHIIKYKWSFSLTFFFYGVRFFTISVLGSLYFKKIIDVLSDSSIPRIELSSVLMHLVWINIGLIVLNYLSSRAGSYSVVYFQSNMIRELADYAFENFTSKTYTFFSNRFTGSLVTKSRRFVRAFEVMHDTTVFSFWSTAIVLIGVFGVLILEAPKIAIIFFVWIIFYLTIVYFVVKKRFLYDVAKAEADSRVGGRLADVFSNIFAVKVFSSKKREQKLFNEVTNDEQKFRDRSWYFQNKQDAIQAFLMVAIQSFVLYLIIDLWIKGVMSTGTVVLIQTYMVIIFDRLWDLGKSITRFMGAAADMSEVIDILEAKDDIRDPENPEPVRMDKGGLEFKNVSFAYQSGQKVFGDFNLKINPGEKIGLVGHSGAGKSTVTKLLLRFVDVSSGAILVDGQDIRNVAQDDLRKTISYVPQEPMLFHRTISDNIAYGYPNASEDEIKMAAQRAHADEFINRLQYGYKTLVGERGVKLSGGERQRVAIARVMLANTPILILDEATSSLDSVSEQYIQSAFEELMKNKTAIVIAHRLSTIQKMDRIIVLDQGGIVEQGTHKELLEKNGVYADLWNHQSGGFME